GRVRSPDGVNRPARDARAEELARLVDNVIDYAIFLLDPEGHVVSWNPGAERLKGYRADEIIGRHFSAFYLPEDVERGHPAEVLQHALGRGRYEEEGWRRRKDGSHFWADIVITALRDNAGTLVGFGKVTRDLTSRRLAEEQLKASTAELRAATAKLEEFRLLVASVRDYAIFLLDPGGHIRSWNIGAEAIKGYTEAEAVGRHFEMFYSAEARARRYPAYELEVAAREGRFEEEGWRFRKDGTRFWANVVITALRDDRGVLVGYAKVTRDLTERRRTEELLRTSAEELAAANALLEASERQARAEASRQRRRTAALELVGRAIVARVDLADIVQTATDAATDLTGAQFGAFFYNVVDADGESYTLYTLSGAAREAFSGFGMPRNTAVFAPTFSGEEIIRSDDITQDPRYGHNRPWFGLPAGHPPVRSHLAVPVITVDGEVAGGMFFGHGDPGVFGPEDEEAAVSIAASAAVAIANARLLEDARRETAAREAALAERDHVARVLQQSLLPPALPAIPGLELGAHYHAGTELVGGDFYDVFALSGRRWGLVVGDVCGSGPEAASQTSLSRHTVRAAAMFDPEPAAVLETLNTALLRSEADRFTTAVFACLSPQPSGQVHVGLASGGHPPAVLCRADGRVGDVATSGPLLGVFEPITLAGAQLVLEPGDTLVLFTDGLVEARRAGTLFGSERLRNAVAALADRPPQEIADALVAAALRHVDAPVSDDIAVVVLRVPA
ncbi:MAG TPA: SpoIIE family protein phosphatase, partial [Baekduia sp.]|nr:SpoIIE family protein phosphatase [Baekduia sp.]